MSQSERKKNRGWAGDLDEAKRRLCASLIGSAREGFSWMTARGLAAGWEEGAKGESEREGERHVNYSFRAAAEAAY